VRTESVSCTTAFLFAGTIKAKGFGSGSPKQYEIQRKIQTFVNRCLRYILRIWWPNIISNKDLRKVTGQEDINLEIRKRKFRWIKKRGWKSIKGGPTFEPSRTQEERKTEKQLEKIGNQGSG